MADYKVNLSFSVQDENSARAYTIEQVVAADKPTIAIAQMVADLPEITGQVTMLDVKTTIVQ
jgi:hypothetical protein